MTQGMNRFAILGVAAVALVSMGAMVAARTAQAQAAAGSKRQLTEAQVLDLQKHFQDATVALDTAAIKRLMADDAIFVHGSALVQTKAELLESMTKGQVRIRAYTSKDSKVTFFNGGAIVSAVTDITLAPQPGVAGTQPFHVQMRISDVWLAKPIGWQLTLHQGTPIQAAPAVRPAAEPSAPSRCSARASAR